MIKKLWEKIKPAFWGPYPDEKTNGEYFYGGDDTWHQTGTVDVQLDENGDVFAVWFRCRMLPFKQSEYIQRSDQGPIQGEGSIKGITFDDE